MIITSIFEWLPYLGSFFFPKYSQFCMLDIVILISQMRKLEAQVDFICCPETPSSVRVQNSYSFQWDQVYRGSDHLVVVPRFGRLSETPGEFLKDTKVLSSRNSDFLMLCIENTFLMILSWPDSLRLESRQNLKSKDMSWGQALWLMPVIWAFW